MGNLATTKLMDWESGFIRMGSTLDIGRTGKMKIRVLFTGRTGLSSREILLKIGYMAREFCILQMRMEKKEFMKGFGKTRMGILIIFFLIT